MLKKDKVLHPLEEAAQKWAFYCIDNLQGDYLDKGLDISKSLMRFVHLSDKE